MKYVNISILIMLLLPLAACDGTRTPHEPEAGALPEGQADARVILGRVFYSYTDEGKIMGCQPFGAGSCGSNSVSPTCISGHGSDEMTIDNKNNRVLLCIK